MPLLAGLKDRNRQAELMDDPRLEATRFLGSLEGLRRVNVVTASVGIVWPSIQRIAERKGSGPLRILDVASGGGDVPLALWRRARKQGIELSIRGCDISPLAVEQGRVRARRAGAEIDFFECDALSEALPERFDIVMSSLFLHHLEWDGARTFLRNVAEAAERAVLISDLVRSRWGYVLASLGIRLLTRCDVCHHDACLSVAGAFTVAEARRLALDAGLEGATVTPRFPSRFLLSWVRP